MNSKTLLLAAAVAVVATTAYAQTKPAAPVAAPAAAAPTAADWRTPAAENVLVIDTNKGRVIVEMVPEVAPLASGRIRELALEHFYDGLTFFRVIDDFMAQTGDPQNNGTGSSPKPDLKAEFQFRRGPELPFALAVDQSVAEVGFVKTLPVTTQSMMLAPMTKDGKISGYGLFCPGVAGAARGQEEDSANSQFFLMRATYPALDRRYTAWGRVLSGLQVVTSLKSSPEPPVPEPQDRMERVRLLSDIPEKDRPKIRVIDTTGPWFKAELARVRTAAGANFSVCDVNIPVEVK